MPSYLPISSLMMKGLANDESSYSVRETGIVICIVTVISIKGRSTSNCDLYHLAPSPKFNIQHRLYFNMRTSLATLFGLLAGALSVHGMTIARRQSGICPGAEGTPLCCDVDVLGVADLDCTPRGFPSLQDILRQCKLTFSSSSDYPNGRSQLCRDLRG